jgi:hypothetical protein
MAVNSINEILRVKHENADYLQEMHRLVAHLWELASTLSFC